MSQSSQHKYKIGQRLFAACRAKCGEFMYRIKSAAELFERVARESEIVRLSSGASAGGA